MYDTNTALGLAIAPNDCKNTLHQSYKTMIRDTPLNMAKPQKKIEEKFFQELQKNAKESHSDATDPLYCIVVVIR